MKKVLAKTWKLNWTLKEGRIWMGERRRKNTSNGVTVGKEFRKPHGVPPGCTTACALTGSDRVNVWEEMTNIMVPVSEISRNRS